MPTSSAHPTTVKIDAAGHWLRADAAASYLRMRAAGMPAGGIDVFGRTLADQKVLYERYLKGQGPLAARPSKTAPHVMGVAMDAHTTTAGKYAPSAAHKWLTAGGDGGSKPKAGERLRAHDYGWRRTVPSERWHFGYDRARDKKRAADLAARLKNLGYKDVKAFQKAHGLTADGIDGPQTWGALLTNPQAAPSPAPKPVPVTPKTATIKVLVANLHDPRFKGPKDSVAQGRFIAGLSPDMVLASESREIDRDDIVAAMESARGETWKVWPSEAGTVGLLWDAGVFSHGLKVLKDFGDKYHGAVATDLTIRSIGRKVRVISTHTRPKAVATDAKKKRDIQLAASLKSGLTLLGGDLAKNKPGSWLTGWHRLTPGTLDTMDAAGHQSPDSLWRYGSGITVAKVQLVNPGSLSDHRWLLVTLTINAASSSL